MTAPRLTLPGDPRRAACDIRVEAVNRLAQGGRWKTEAMRSYSHPVLLWFTSGQGRITVAGTTRGYGAHTAAYVPAHTMFGYSISGRCQGHAVYLADTLDLDWPSGPLILRLREVTRQTEMTGLIDALSRELETARAGAARAAYHRAGLLAVFLDQQAGEAEKIDTDLPENAAAKLAAGFIAAVERDGGSTRPVADYADELGVTPAHLSRACTQATGRNALQLVGERNFDAAEARAHRPGEGRRAGAAPELRFRRAESDDAKP